MSAVRRRAWWKKALLALGALVVGAGGFMVYRIGPRNVVGMLRYDQRREGDLQVGDKAPDVAAYPIDGVGKTSILTAAPGQPLVLVFGSFT